MHWLIKAEQVDKVRDNENWFLQFNTTLRNPGPSKINRLVGFRNLELFCFISKGY